MNKTIAQQLNIKDFPFRIKDKHSRLLYYEESNNYWERWERDSDGNERYYEDSNGYSARWEYDSMGNQIYMEHSDGVIIDNRTKEAPNKEQFGAIFIKDADIATIERLHDMVLDAGLSEMDSEELKKSRELTKKMYCSIYPDYKLKPTEQ